MRCPVHAGLRLLHGGAAVTLLVGGAQVEAGVRELHQDRGGAEVKVFRQEVVLHFRAAQAAAVGVHVDGPLVHGAAWRGERGRKGGRQILEAVL